MKDSSSPRNDVQAIANTYCDRCARRSSQLVLDDLSLQELCEDCIAFLARRRAIRAPLSL